jgi:hypothetical protein
LLRRGLAVALRWRIVTLRRRATMGRTLRRAVLLLRMRRLLIALLVALGRALLIALGRALRRCTLRITVGRLLFFTQTS